MALPVSAFVSRPELPPLIGYAAADDYVTLQTNL